MNDFYNTPAYYCNGNEASWEDKEEEHHWPAWSLRVVSLDDDNEDSTNEKVKQLLSDCFSISSRSMESVLRPVDNNMPSYMSSLLFCDTDDDTLMIEEEEEDDEEDLERADAIPHSIHVSLPPSFYNDDEMTMEGIRLIPFLEDDTTCSSVTSAPTIDNDSSSGHDQESEDTSTRFPWINESYGEEFYVGADELFPRDVDVNISWKKPFNRIIEPPKEWYLRMK